MLKVKKSGVGLEKARYRAFYAIMAPFIFFFLLSKGYPLVWGLYISFTNFTGFNLDNLTFVGLANFKRVFVDNEALPSILRVIGIGVITVPVGTVICVTISLILSNTFRGVGVFRTLFYLPSVIPAVAIALMWKGIYAYDGGLFNFVRELFGAEAVNWLGFDYVKRALIIMMLWTSGGGALTIIAAIKGIPDDLYEAADIEGVGPVSKTFKITLPLVSNMIYMHITTSIIGTLQLFAQPESTVAHLGQGVGQVNGLDGGSPEALGSNGGHALWDGHVRQRRGAVKEVLAQNGNALLHHDLGNLGHVGLPGLAVLGIIRGGCAGAGQRQHAVGVTPVHVTGGAGGLGGPGHGGQAHAEDQCQAQHQAQKPFDCRLHTFLLLK